MLELAAYVSQAALDAVADAGDGGDAVGAGLPRDPLMAALRPRRSRRRELPAADVRHFLLRRARFAGRAFPIHDESAGTALRAWLNATGASDAAHRALDRLVRGRAPAVLVPIPADGAGTLADLLSAITAIKLADMLARRGAVAAVPVIWRPFTAAQLQTAAPAVAITPHAGPIVLRDGWGVDTADAARAELGNRNDDRAFVDRLTDQAATAARQAAPSVYGDTVDATWWHRALDGLGALMVPDAWPTNGGVDAARSEPSTPPTDDPVARMNAALQAMPVVAIVGNPRFGNWTDWLHAGIGPRDQPQLVPALRATLIEPRVARALRKLGLTLADALAISTDALEVASARAIDRGPALPVLPADPDAIVARYRDAVLARLFAWEAARRRGGFVLDRRVHDLAVRLEARLDRLRLLLARQREHELARREAWQRTLRDGLTPGGSPQDEVLSVAHLVARYGPSIAQELAQVLTLDDTRHAIVRVY